MRRKPLSLPLSGQASERPGFVLYARVSTTDQANHGDSLDTQRARLKEWSERSGFSALRFSDTGSGSRDFFTVLEPKKRRRKVPEADTKRRLLFSREGLSRGLAKIKAGKAQGIAATAADRLTRNPTDANWLVKFLVKHKARLVLLDTPGVNVETPLGRALFRNLVVLAHERDIEIGEQTKRGMARAKAQGKARGAPPFGWRYENRHLVKVPPEQETIHWIVKLHGDNKGLNVIAQQLDREGVSTKNGAPAWNHKQVGTILERAGVRTRKTREP